MWLSGDSNRLVSGLPKGTRGFESHHQLHFIGNSMNIDKLNGSGKDRYSPECLTALKKMSELVLKLVELADPKLIASAQYSYNKIKISNPYVDVVIMQDKNKGVADIFYKNKVDWTTHDAVFSVVLLTMVHVTNLLSEVGLQESSCFGLPDDSLLEAMMHKEWTPNTTDQLRYLVGLCRMDTDIVQFLKSIRNSMKDVNGEYQLPESVAA